MLNVIGLIIYLILAFLTVAIIYSIQTDEVDVGIYGINGVAIFLVGLIAIPLFGLPLLSSLLFIIAGIAISLISLTYPNRLLLMTARFTSRILFIGMPKEGRKGMRLNSYAEMRKGFKTEEDDEEHAS